MAIRMRGADKTRETLKGRVENARTIFWEHIKNGGWLYDEKAMKLEKNIEIAEYNLYCYEYEDNRRRIWR